MAKSNVKKVTKPQKPTATEVRDRAQCELNKAIASSTTLLAQLADISAKRIRIRGRIRVLTNSEDGAGWRSRLPMEISECYLDLFQCNARCVELYDKALQQKAILGAMWTIVKTPKGDYDKFWNRPNVDGSEPGSFVGTAESIKRLSESIQNFVDAVNNSERK